MAKTTKEAPLHLNDYKADRAPLNDWLEPSLHLHDALVPIGVPFQREAAGDQALQVAPKAS